MNLGEIFSFVIRMKNIKSVHNLRRKRINFEGVDKGNVGF